MHGETEDNRARLITFCKVEKMVLANTTFQKPASKLATYRELGTDKDDKEYIRGKYEQLDYCIIHKR